MYKSITMLILFSFSALFFSCLDFGEDFETLNPSDEQIAQCMDSAWILSDYPLDVQGIKWLGSGIDKAFWVAFTVEADTLSQIFHPDVITDELNTANPFIPEGPAWWLPSGLEVQGGQVALPSGSYANVYWIKDNRKIRVSLFYFET